MVFYCANQWGLTPLASLPNIPTGYCNPPLNLAVGVPAGANLSSNKILLSWEYPHDVLYFVLEYKISTDSDWTAVNVYGSSYVLEGTPNNLYNWRVNSVCSISNISSKANGPNFTTGDYDDNCIPPNPGNFSVSFASTGVTISWSGTSAIYYKTELRLKDSVTVLLARQVTLPSIKYTTLAPNTNYEIRVKSICQGTESEWSEWYEFNSGTYGACPQVKNVIPVIGISAVSLSWIKPSGVISVNVLLNGTLYLTGVTTSSVNISGLSPNTEYTVTLVSVCELGSGDPLDIPFKTKPTECLPPTNLVLTVNQNQIIAEWTPAAGIAAQEIILNNGNVVNLAADTNTYTYTVTSTGIVFVVAVRSICSTTTSAFIDKSIFVDFYCLPPTGLAQIGISYKAVTIGWNLVPGAVSYQAKLYKTSDNSLIGTVNTTSGYANYDGLSPNTSYYAKVITVCNGGNSAESSQLDITTPVTPSCETPVVFEITEITSTSAKITFIMSDGQSVGSFKLEVRNAANSIVFSQDNITTTGTYQVTGLTPGNAHVVRVYNHGDGVCIESFGTKNFNTPSTCPAPTLASAAFISNSVMRVSFTGSLGASNYKVKVIAMDGTVYTGFGTASPIDINVPETEYSAIQLSSFCSDVESDPVVILSPCPQPRNFVAEYINGKVNLSWDGQIGGTYRITIIPTLAPTYTVVTDKPIYTLSNLIPSNAYKFYVNRICSDGIYSAATDMKTIITPGNGGRVIPPEDDTEYVNEDPIIFEVIERDADPVMVPCVPIPDCPDGFQIPNDGCTGNNNCGCGCNGNPGTGKPYLAGRNIYIEDKGTHFLVHNIAPDVGVLKYTHGIAEAPATTISMPGLKNKSIIAAFTVPNAIKYIIDEGTPNSDQILIDREAEEITFGTEIMPGQEVWIIIRGLIAGEDGSGGGGELPPDIADRLVFGEIPVGAIDGSNATYTTAYPFVPGTESFRRNGLDQKLGEDYTTTGGNTLIFIGLSPEADDDLEIDYVKAI